MPGRFPPSWGDEAASAAAPRCVGARRGVAAVNETLLPTVLSRRAAADFLGAVHQDLCPRSRASAFAEVDAREKTEDVKQEATRARSKAQRVEERSVWIKTQAKGSYKISKNANRVAFGALLFTILGVGLDTISNIITVFSTKRMMNDLEDEAAQVVARRRNEQRTEQR
ncbi:unnamed protein product [Symbiodinium sp. CCMP2456]|nr:unnamed protein product [Symbiodinium sp. CCMP2456]